MLLVDIVVLCDVELEVGKLVNVYFYSVDDLQSIILYNLVQCQVVVVEVEMIVEQEVSEFMVWLCVQGVSEIIWEYCSQLEQICDELIIKVLLVF